jgi:hypothetical protein
MRRWIVLLLCCLPLTAMAGDDAPAWPGDFTSRVEALALLETLNADLLSHDSATLTLERWCGAHGMAAPAKVVAEAVRGAARPLPPELRAALGIAADVPVKHRQVRLSCGGRVLSEADNWYVPARLTADMNRTLDTTDIPFGKVVQPLHFRRKTLAAELLWSPLPQGWEQSGAGREAPAGDLAVPAHVLQHRAVLYTGDNQPFSALIETYTSQVLAFPRKP